MEQGYREIPHTADVELEVWGKDLPELFTHAAQGLFSLAVRFDPEPRISAHRVINLSAPDWETLLVDWLNELILLSDENEEAYVAFEVELPGVGQISARACATTDFTRTKVVKAATFHNLTIKEGPEGVRATIVFDV